MFQLFQEKWSVCINKIQISSVIVEIILLKTISVKALKFLHEWLTDTSSIEEWLSFYSRKYVVLVFDPVSR